MDSLGRTIFDIWRWVGIVLYLLLAWQMASLLTSPGPEDGLIILTFGMMMGFEFILVHSGVFMALFPRRISLLVFVPIYGIFALAMNSMIPGNMILWLYLSVVFTRMRFAFSNPTPGAISLNSIFSIAAVTTYFLLVCIFAFGNGLVPHFGLTESYLQSIRYADLHDSGGIFIDMPHVPLSMGVIYFTLLSFYEGVIPKAFRPKDLKRG